MVSRNTSRVARELAVRVYSLAALCVSLSVLLFAHALSSVTAKRDPSFALDLFPWNGEASEHLASDRFQAGLSDGEERGPAAKSALPEALEAFGSHPLSPDAHAIAILSSNDPIANSDALRLASALNRRDSNLQGLVLENAILSKDEGRAVVAIDQILRIHPEYAKELFPLLLDAFTQPGSVEAFVRYLNGSAPWHEDFYIFALSSDAALPSLAQARASLGFLPQTFDQRLIERLIKVDRIATAHSVYLKATGRPKSLGSDTLGWDSGFPPLDWRLEDRAGFRAQKSLNSPNLELAVSPGKGGVVASRLLERSDGSYKVSVNIIGASTESFENLRLALRCKDETQAFEETQLQVGLNQWSLSASDQPACQYRFVELRARVLRGKKPLRVELSNITIATE